MDKYTATELAFKNGYEKGYEAGKTKWIPVSERLPMEGVDVLCFSTECVKPLCVYAYIGNGKWEEPDNNWNYGDLLGITHWMPLPEAPKEGE